MNLRELQDRVDKWIKSYGVRYFDEKTNTLLLMEEMGEFTRLVARTYGEQSFKDKTDEQGVKEKIADEIADIIFVLNCLANQMEIDIEQAVERNFNKKTERDAERHRNNDKINN